MQHRHTHAIRYKPEYCRTCDQQHDLLFKSNPRPYQGFHSTSWTPGVTPDVAKRQNISLDVMMVLIYQLSSNSVSPQRETFYINVVFLRSLTDVWGLCSVHRRRLIFHCAPATCCTPLSDFHGTVLRHRSCSNRTMSRQIRRCSTDCCCTGPM